MPKLTNTIILRVDEVNTATKTVACQDNMGGKISATYRSSTAAFQIPQQGERWMADKIGYQWHLTSRWDDSDETSTKADLNPGDVHLRTPGTLHIDAQAIQTASGGLGATTRENLHGNSSATVFSLTSVPINEDSVMVYKNGAFMHPDSDYHVDQGTITFAAAPASSDKITVHYQRGGAVYRDKFVFTSISSSQSSDIYTV